MYMFLFLVLSIDVDLLACCHVHFVVLNLQAFILKFVEIGKVLFSLSVIDSSQGQQASWSLVHYNMKLQSDFIVF